jgi:hypothetical protein
VLCAFLRNLKKLLQKDIVLCENLSFGFAAWPHLPNIPLPRFRRPTAETGEGLLNWAGKCMEMAPIVGRMLGEGFDVVTDAWRKRIIFAVGISLLDWYNFVIGFLLYRRQHARTCTFPALNFLGRPECANRATAAKAASPFAWFCHA